MKKGGYKIIDFKGTELSTTAVEILGIFEQIMDNYDKPILVSGVILNGELQDDAYAGVQGKIAQDLSKYVELTVYGGVITVTEDDNITFASAMSNTELTEDVGTLMNTSLMKTNSETLTADLNDAVNGWSYYSSSSTNRPGDDGYYVLTLVHTVSKAQLAIGRNTGILFTRTYTASAWGAWAQATNA